MPKLELINTRNLGSRIIKPVDNSFSRLPRRLLQPVKGQTLTLPKGFNLK